MEKQIIEISWNTVWKVLFVVLLVLFLYAIRDVVAIILFSLVIASAVDPLAVWFQKRGVSRILTVLLVYVLFFSLFGLAIYLIIPPILSELGELSRALPSYLEKITSFVRQIQPTAEQDLLVNVKGFLEQVEGNLGSIASNTLAAATNIFGGVTSAILIVIISFYLSIREHGIDNFLRAIIPVVHENYVMGLWVRSKRKIGQWAQGQLLLGFIVGVAVYAGLFLLGVKYALILGIIAGIAELVPIVGVMVSGTTAVLLSAAQEPFLGVMVLLLFVIIQQLENHVIVPQVMRRIVGLSPLVIVLSLLIGLRLGGILGMLLAIPVAAVIVEFWSDFEKKKIEA